MIRILLVRHGETEWNKTHRLQGQSSIDLAETGRAQAQAAGRYVRSQNPAQGYVSTLERTAQTYAEFGLDHAPEVMGDLSEQHLGEWEGMKTAQAKDAYPDLYKAWKSGEGTPPGGEAPEALVERMSAAFFRVVRAAADVPATQSADEKYPLRTAVVVSHGTSIKALLEALGLIDRTRVISVTAGAVSVIDVPLHGGPLSSSLPNGGLDESLSAGQEAEAIRALTDEQIRDYAKLRMFNLSPEVLALV